MRWKPHVRFGGRAEESEQPKGRNRASARSNHTHATLLMDAGVPPKVISERLGHSRASFTEDAYQHILPGMQADAAAVFADLVADSASTGSSESTREKTRKKPA